MDREWIPVTEKKPELYEKVLVTRFGYVEIAYRTDYTATGETAWFVDNDSMESDECPNIKAWMPLPNPYGWR